MTDAVALFLEADHKKWLFPLRTPLMFAKSDATALREHIEKTILSDKQPDGFLTGQVAYSRKDVHHLRRVLVLDPFAAFFIYDFVHANRKSFTKPPKSTRRVYGHSFHKGQPVDAFAEYHAFRRRKYELVSEHRFFAQLDVFNCFNSFYHHEVTSFVTEKTSQAHGSAFGQFLRELNAGVSVACFPQGLYPAKVIGNAYLSFIENSRKLKARGVARFLDDVVLAGPSRRDVEENILELQYLLDKHHLSLNDSKTLVGEKGQRFQERRLDRMKRTLLAKRESVRAGYDEKDDGSDEDEGLSSKERDYLTSMIRKRNVAQEDVELALTLLRDEPDALRLLAEPVLDNAPHLLKEFHRFICLAEDTDGLLRSALDLRLRSGRTFPEHDLFWYARILIDNFEFDQDVADLLIKIYEHPSASPVVRAAILETDYLQHGFADLKESAIRGEGTLLIAAAAMVGLTRLEKAKRNHTLKYVARQGAHAAALMKIAGKMVA